MTIQFQMESLSETEIISNYKTSIGSGEVKTLIKGMYLQLSGFGNLDREL